MDEKNKKNKDEKSNIISLKKTNTFGTEFYKKRTLIGKREISIDLSKKLNKSQMSSKSQIKENIIDSENTKKFISNSKLKLDDMKYSIANNKIKNYINNLLGQSGNNIYSDRNNNKNQSLNVSPNHGKIVDSPLKNQLIKKKHKKSYGNSLKSLDLKNNFENNNNNLKKIPEIDSNQNMLSSLGLMPNNNVDKNFNVNYNDHTNNKNFSDNRKLNKLIGGLNNSNDFKENLEDLSQRNLRSFTSKIVDDSENNNLNSFLHYDPNKKTTKKNQINEFKLPNINKNYHKDLNMSHRSNLNSSNLLTLKENNIKFQNEKKNECEVLEKYDINQNIFNFHKQNTKISSDRILLDWEFANIKLNKKEKKNNFFLGLNSYKKKQNQNPISKKSDIDMKRNSSLLSNKYNKNPKLLGYDFALKNNLLSANKIESDSNNYLMNKSLTNSNVLINKNRDFSFESENLDREILNLHLKYSKNNFDEIIQKKKKRNGRRSAALIRGDLINNKIFYKKTNQVNITNKDRGSSNNLKIDINNILNYNLINNKKNSNTEEVNAILETNNYLNTLDSKNNLIPQSEYLRNRENSSSSRKNNINQPIIIGSNPFLNNKNTNFQILENIHNINNFNNQKEDNETSTNKLFQPVQVNIPSNLKIGSKNYNKNFDIDLKNVKKNLGKKKFQNINEDSEEYMDRRYSSANSSQDERSIKIFHNIYDSFSGEEWDESKAIKPIYILKPDCLFKEIIDILSTLFTFYTIIYSPYQMAFENDANPEPLFMVYIDIFIDFFFVLDFLLNFIIAYRDEKDDLIFSLNKIFCNYVKSWFLFDLISCLPFSFINYLFFQDLNSEIVLIDSSNNGNMGNGVTKLQRFAKIAKFYRVLKWSKILRLLKITKSDNNAKNLFSNIDGLKSSINRFLKFLIIFIFLIHFASCIWIFVANLSMSNGDPVNWITYYDLIDQSNIQIYITSIYFIIVTVFSIGYGDITPKSFEERFLCLFILTIGCLIFSYALSSLSNIFSQIDKKKEIYNKKESILNEIKLEYKLDKELDKKIQNSLKHDLNSWNEDRLKLLDSLPSILKNQLYLKMYEEKIKNLIFFNNQSYEFITLTIGYLKSVKFSKHDYIISIGEIIYEMYLTITGLIGVELGTKYQKHEICIIPKNFHFGDILMYTNQQTKLSYKVKTYSSELFILSKINYAQIKLAFDKPTSKLLERSYEFFMKIERTRILAIKYFERNGSFDNFKIYLKKYVNNKNMQFKKEYYGMEFEDNEMSMEQDNQSNFDNYNSRQLSNSDIFTIRSQKSNISNVIDESIIEDNFLEKSINKKINSKFSKLSKSGSLRENSSYKNNKLSYGHHTNFLTSNINDENFINFENLNKSQIIDEKRTEIIEKDMKINQENEIPSINAEDKNFTSIIKKNTLNYNNLKPSEKRKEGNSLFLTRSKTTKCIKKKSSHQDIKEKLKHSFPKNKTLKIKNHDSLKGAFEKPERENNNMNNITLNYKGFNINSMMFSKEEKKKLKFRYDNLNLNFSSDSSFFDSEKDDFSNFVNEATIIQRSKTCKVKYNNINKNNKSQILKKKAKKKHHDNSKINNLNISSKKESSISKFSSSIKTEKEVNIKNQLIRALTITTKKNFTEDFNNFYAINYNINESINKVKNIDKKVFSRKNTLRNHYEKNKFYSKFKNNNNTIKEKNSMKNFDENSKLSEQVNDLISDHSNQEKPVNKNIYLNDQINKENINNNFRSDISILNSTNSKKIIYINNLNINYSNQNNTNSDNLLNNKLSKNNVYSNLDENNCLINQNPETLLGNTGKVSLESKFGLDKINKIINKNNFINQDNHLNLHVNNQYDSPNLTDIKNPKKINKINRNKEINDDNPNKSNIIKEKNRNKAKNSYDFNIDKYDFKSSDNSNSIKFKNVNINTDNNKSIGKNYFYCETCDKFKFNNLGNKLKSPIRQNEKFYKELKNSSKNEQSRNSENKSPSLKKKLKTIIPDLSSPEIKHADNYETDGISYNKLYNKIITKSVVDKKSKTTKIKQNNLKGNSLKEKNNYNYNNDSNNLKKIFDSNKGIDFYSKLNIPIENNFGNGMNNINIFQNIKPNNSSNYNSYQNHSKINSMISGGIKSYFNNKQISENNVIKNKTFKSNRSPINSKPCITTKKSAIDVINKNPLYPNSSNNFVNTNSMSSGLNFLKKKSFLDIPKNYNDINREQDFLKILSNKITYDAFLYKNKELLQNCIKGFLDDIQGESTFKHIMNRLNNLELKMKEYIKNSKTIVNNRKKNSKKFLERLEKKSAKSN